MTEGIRLTLTAPTSTPSAEASAATTSPPPTSAASFRQVLEDAATEMGRREAALDRVLTHRSATPLGPEQLLALQATVHRYSQEVELAAKLTDKLTGAVRQVLTSQQ